MPRKASPTGRKTSVSFSLNAREFGMLEEMCNKKDMSRSEWLQLQINMEYIVHGTAKQIKLHAVGHEQRKWGLNEFNEPRQLFPDGGGYCNHNIACPTCTPIWEMAKQRRKEMLK
jgi:hypothetical protein